MQDPELSQSAFVATMRVADALGAAMASQLKADRLSPPLYNVLRIVRGAGADGVRCGEISERMISRDPDVTRLVERLARRRLVIRRRDPDDGRVVRVGITATGRSLLGRLDGPVLALHRAQFAPLSHRELATLVRLLGRVDRP